MSRVIWKGHISFGLVQIPVGLHPATQDKDLSFSLIDRRDQSPIGYKKINKRTGEEVTSQDIVKAIEHDEGEYVVLSDEELAAANAQATQTIDIVSFVDGADLEPRLFVRPYYVAPTKKSAKAYALLRETMRRTGKVGIAKVVLRTRQYVAALVVHEDILVLELLRYAHELRDFDEFDLPGDNLAKLGVSERELKMAEQLVAGLEDTWDPSAYRDDFYDDVKRLIEEKARTGEVTVKREVADDQGDAGSMDIMALLKKSLEATTGAGKANGAKAASAKPKTKTRAVPATGPKAKTSTTSKTKAKPPAKPSATDSKRVAAGKSYAPKEKTATKPASPAKKPARGR